MPNPKGSRFFAFAMTECLLLFPATLLLAAAVLRSIQPPQYEPALASSLLLHWITVRLSHFDSAVLFIGLPAVSAFLGGIVTRRVWRQNQEMRRDLSVAAAILRRHASVVLVVTATILASAILAASVAHLFTD